MITKKQKKILDAINRLGGKGISFIELEREIPEAFGDRSLQVATNCFVWAFDPEWVDAFNELVNSDKIIVKQTHILVYLCDGMPSWLAEYKIAKSARPYKTMRWLPVCINKGA
jgi:hypothetical protein